MSRLHQLAAAIFPMPMLVMLISCYALDADFDDDVTLLPLLLTCDGAQPVPTCAFVGPACCSATLIPLGVWWFVVVLLLCLHALQTSRRTVKISSWVRPPCGEKAVQIFSSSGGTRGGWCTSKYVERVDAPTPAMHRSRDLCPSRLTLDKLSAFGFRRLHQMFVHRHCWIVKYCCLCRVARGKNDSLGQIASPTNINACCTL